jgi:quercetin dioxygenase-like cupin family protein
MIKVPTSGKVLTIGDSEVCIKVSSGETAAGYELVLNNVPAGFGPPAHVHRRMEQAFYVLEGRVSFQLGGDWVEADPGEVVVVPPGTAHTFANRTQKAAQLLQINSGGALEPMFEDLARAFPAGSQQDSRRLGEIMAAHDHLPPKVK